MFGLSFYFGLSMTLAALIIEHWVPWPRKLHRLETYSLGLGAILLGQGIWLGCHCIFSDCAIVTNGWALWLTLAGWALLSGLVVKATWVIDKILNYRANARSHKNDSS